MQVLSQDRASLIDFNGFKIAKPSIFTRKKWVIYGRLWDLWLLGDVRPVWAELGFYSSESAARAVFDHIIISVGEGHKVFEMPADFWNEPDEVGEGGLKCK